MSYPKHANARLCKQLFVELGRPNVNIKDMDLWAMGARGKVLGLTTGKFDLNGFKEFIPAYSLSDLVNMALETGHYHIKIKQGKKSVIVTAPPCYHIEAKSPADGVAQLLIKSAKRDFVQSKPKKIEVKHG